MDLIIHIAANVFVSSGILKFKKELIIMFENMDISSDTTNFEEFMKVISVNSLSNKLQMERLDAIIDDAAGGLSANTIIAHERRKLLLEHVVDRPAVRAWGIDHSASMFDNPHKLHRRERRAIHKVEESHRKERFEATEIVWELKNALKNSKKAEIARQESIIRAASMAVPKPTVADVLRPLDDIFEGEMSAKAKAEEEALQQMVTLMPSPIKKERKAIHRGISGLGADENKQLEEDTSQVRTHLL